MQKGTWQHKVKISQAASIACLTLVPCCAVRCRTALLAVGPRTRAAAEGSTRGIFQQTWDQDGNRMSLPRKHGDFPSFSRYLPENTMPDITSEHLEHLLIYYHLFLLLGVMMLARIGPYLNCWLGWGGMGW